MSLLNFIGTTLLPFPSITIAPATVAALGVAMDSTVGVAVAFPSLALLAAG